MFEDYFGVFLVLGFCCVLGRSGRGFIFCSMQNFVILGIKFCCLDFEFYKIFCLNRYCRFGFQRVRFVLWGRRGINIRLVLIGFQLLLIEIQGEQERNLVKSVRFFRRLEIRLGGFFRLIIVQEFIRELFFQLFCYFWWVYIYCYVGFWLVRDFGFFRL